MDFKELQDFIKSIVRSGATEVNLEMGELKLSIKTPAKGKLGQTLEQPVIQQITMPQQPIGMVAAPALQQQMLQQNQMVAANNDAATTKEEVISNYLTIKSPMVGTFYRKPAPNKPDFVNIGDMVSPGKVVCIVEAMKLFNEIESEISGKIVKILVDEASPIEFDQPLFLVDPS